MSTPDPQRPEAAGASPSQQEAPRTAEDVAAGLPDDVAEAGAGGVRDPAPAPEADGAWHRMHPVTPLVRGWAVLAVALFFWVQQRGDAVFTGDGDIGSAVPGRTELLVSLGVLALGILVISAWAVLTWRMTRYRVGEEVVELHSGVLSRQQRRVRLDRLQAVDVVQPLVARLTGLSELKLEVAGGSGSDVSLAYLRSAEAQRLRRTLLARAAGVQYEEGQEAPEAPEREILEVPVGRLLMSFVRSSWLPVLLLGIVGLGSAVVVTGRLGVVLAAVPALFGVGAGLWGAFSRGFGFRVAVSPDGLRLRHGLTETRAQTVPPGRVQAVRLRQPLLWRGPDWWEMAINVAGYSGASGEDSGKETVLLPVGTRAEALAVLALVLPALAPQVPADALPGAAALTTGEDPDVVADAGAEPPDVADVADAATGAVEAGLTGTGTDGGYTPSPESSRWLDPVSWRRNGYCATDTALLCRSGRVLRQLVVVPHERTQSLALVQGPLQRRLGVASVVAHSTPGPVGPRVDHLPGAAAAALLAEQAHRARTARRSAGPEQWMTALAEEVGAGADDGPDRGAAAELRADDHGEAALHETAGADARPATDRAPGGAA